MTLISDLTDVLGAAHVITGAGLQSYTIDVTQHYRSAPVAVVRPADRGEVVKVMQIAQRHGVAVLPASGRTGLTGGLMTEGGLIVSVERLNKIREIKPAARVAIVEAGVILDSLHAAAEAEGLYFPLWFGARGSAMIGGVLSTNAGGSNVVRYGSTRALCLGLEVVLADGRVLNLMSQLHKDNSGYDLKQMFIGAEGTLGVITAAVMKLVPRPRTYATATLAVANLPDALELLHKLQAASGGAVEAFEYMPKTYMQQMARARPEVRQPFTPPHEVTILVELGSIRPDDANLADDGSVPLTSLLENTLAEMMEAGQVLDAEIAQNEAQRAEMWRRRELASEVMTSRQPTIDTDICLPTDLVAPFLDAIHARLPQIDAAAETISVAHLGDGNVHFTVYPSDDSAAHSDRVIEEVEDVVQALGGSFSAEHGVGLSKLASMKRRKDPVALDVMRAIKLALDPEGRMNPGKVIPA